MLRHIGPISGVATHQNRYVATAGYDNRVILWTPDRIAIACGQHDHLANQCSFSPDGHYLVSASSDYTARLWEIPSMRLRSVLDIHTDDVEMASFDPSGQYVATCSRDRSLAVFNLDGSLVSHLTGHTDDVISITWDINTGNLVSSSDDGTVRKWDTSSGALLETVDLHNVQTDTLAITNDGLIYAGNDSGELIHVGPQLVCTKAHKAGIKRLIYSATSNLLVSMSYDRFAAFWKIAADGTLREIARTELPAIVWPRSGAFLGETRLAVATFGSTFALFDLKTGLWDAEHIRPSIGLNAVVEAEDGQYTVGDAGRVECDGKPVARMGSLCNFLLPFGSRVLTGGQLGRLFDARTGEILYQYSSPLNCGAIFRKNEAQYVIIGTYTGEGLIFKVQENEITFVRSLKLHKNAIKGIACSPTRIFSVCATGAARFHAIETFNLIKDNAAAHDRIANGCTFVGDECFASISRDKKLRLWRNSSAEVFETPHRNSIKCITASVCGRWIATGGYAGQVAVFNRIKKEWVSSERPTAAGISSLTAGRASRDFFASSYDGAVYRVSSAERMV